ncbi:nucleoporin NUP42 [Geospiza fortis]|uniref:Nucleoporin NUP42 n=1 Tax=Geospiza fortis TaxID=48883 RepID=A0A8N5HXV8_GEOFO|nr:nucleoporin NUP42 [Geospiza fortis]
MSLELFQLSAFKATGIQAAPAFGMGGQQTSGFGLSSFPVSSSSSSTSASSFSFKASSSLISSASSGSSPAAGSSSAAANPPAFGTASSPSTPQSVGFGSPAAASAASFCTSGRGGGGWGTSNQRYSNVIQPSSFKSDTWGGSRDHGRGFFGSSDFGSSGGSSRNAGFSQNRFSALANSQSVADGSKDEEERLLECVVKDMEIWESSGQWIFSCYSPMKEKPNVSGFSDVSPEELRVEYYDSRANNIIGNYIDAVQNLALQWKNRLLQLKGLNASTKSSLLSAFKATGIQAAPAFGMGGQQTSGFGLSSFPVSSSSSSTSASSFSFKASSSLISSASSGSSPAAGSSSAAANPPAFGTSPTTAAFGAFGATVAPSGSPSSGALFGQSGSASAHPVTSVSAAATHSSPASDKLFTPKSELSAEEWQQFEAKEFTIGKIPLKPPPLELLNAFDLLSLFRSNMF